MFSALNKTKSKVAILIPLYGRKEFTERFLQYYNSRKCNFTFYISDGSKKKEFTQNYFNKKYKSLNIKYQRFNYDKNYVDFSFKLYQTVKSIKNEKYIYFCTNDDFFNINFLIKAEQFLEKNSTYNSVFGIMYKFRVTQILSLINDHGFISGIALQYNKYLDISSSNTNKRIKMFNQSYPWESLTRKKILFEVFYMAYKFRVQNYFELTWFWLLIPLIKGKKKFLDKVSLARQSNTYFNEGTNTTFIKITKKRYQEFCSFLEKKIILKFKLNKFIRSLDIEVNEHIKVSKKKKLLILVIKLKKKIIYFISLFPFLYLCNLNKKKYDKLFKNIDNLFR